MTKKIVVLSDGTGNAASKVWRTNVWRVFELLDLAGTEQVAKYDDGVGSSSFKPAALLGGAFGWGLKRNVIDLYKFVCRNYQDDAQIYGFGFSRGAFTIRILVGLILQQGLVPYHSEVDLHARARDAYREFRRENFHSFLRLEWVFRKLRDGFVHLLDRILSRRPYSKSDNRVVPSIEFIGVWDTVAAYGLPVEEMTRGVSQYIWPLELPQRRLHPKVRRACHALALDDERTTFHPVLWTEEGESGPSSDENGQVWLKDERISQVWFAGVHSNVGGGYPDDALSYLSLLWIMEEARLRGLVFKAMPHADPDAFLSVMSARDKDGRQYNSRAGLGGYYRYGPRKIADLCNARLSGRERDEVHIAQPKIHESALARMRSDCNAYAPIGLPANYAVATFDGRIVQGNTNSYERPTEAAARARNQEKVWNLVWVRRIVYFVTLAASLHLAAFWLFHPRNAEHEYLSSIRLVSEAIRLVEAFFPREVVHWWTDWYAANPEWFLGGVIVLGVLLWLGSKLETQITDWMRLLWKSRAQQSTIEDSSLHWAIYRFRSNRVYQVILRGMKRYALPFISAVLLLWLGIGATSHFLFNLVDSSGAYCAESSNSETVFLRRAGQESAPITFHTNAMCAPTKVLVQRGVGYSVTITASVQSPWSDGGIETNPSGFGTSTVDNWPSRALMYAGLPLRRVIFRRWFSLLARVGSKGNAEGFLDPDPVAEMPGTFRGLFRRAERDGELFLYVNDAVVPLPWISDIFYRNNRGMAQVVIKRLN
jgi:uncharacterized protein (DUF2235 family)